jgi:predicted alpha/beta-hydrolase family hydrolase
MVVVERVVLNPDIENFRIAVPNAVEVSAILVQPAKPAALFVLAHGAGAGMRHPFLETLSRELVGFGVATLRYQFPYMGQRRKVPDSPKILTETVRAAVRAANERVPGVPLFAGGKSMGGRMTSLAASPQPLESVRGLIFVGFPLHPPQKPGMDRAEHLFHVSVPMLFLQGTRDAFAKLDLLRPVVEKLGTKATLHIVDTADHSFRVLKQANKTQSEIMQHLADTISKWMRAVIRAGD